MGWGVFKGANVAMGEAADETGRGVVVGGGEDFKTGDAIEELEAENARLEKALEVAVAAAPAVAAEEEGRTDAVSPIMEAMAAFGAEQARTSLAMEAVAFAERFGLDEEQQARVSEIMAEVQQLRQEAGMKVFAGQATIGDMVLSDPDNHTALDEAIMGIMGEDQVAAYKVYQDEREAERIEKKVDQDMAGLEAVGGLTDEQREAAWQVFAEANAETRPGNAPEGTDLNDIETWVDGCGRATDRRTAADFDGGADAGLREAGDGVPGSDDESGEGGDGCRRWEVGSCDRADFQVSAGVGRCGRVGADGGAASWHGRGFVSRGDFVWNRAVGSVEGGAVFGGEDEGFVGTTSC